MAILLAVFNKIGGIIVSTKYDVFSNKFSQDIYLQKYSMDGQEQWSDTCRRVVNAVCGQLLDTKSKEKIYNYMLERKFIPGGRYLYSSGRPFHQVNNCFLFRAEDSRESWAELTQKATAALMTGGGIGVDYSNLREEGAIIKRTGGRSTGPIALLNITNELGRYVMQGGQRRSAIFGSLKWSHPDVFKFMEMKNHSEELKALKNKDFNFPLPMELTNISVDYDTEFFIAIDQETHPKHELAKKVWRQNCLQAFSTAEPGMIFNFRKDNENLRNAPVSARTNVLTRNGYAKVGDIIGTEVQVWTGKQWAKTIFKKTKENANLVEVTLTNGRSIICDPEHPFIVKNFIGAGKNKKIEIRRVSAKDLSEDQKLLSDLPMNTSFDKRVIFNTKEYGMGFVFGDGSISNGRGEISYHIEDKKESFLVTLDGLNARTVNQPNRAYFKCNLDSKASLLNKSVLSLDFISGWFDADGCYTRNMLRISNSTKENLIKLQESLDFYGIKSVVREDGNSSYKPENKMYTLGVLSDSLLIFKNRIPTVRLKLNLDDNYSPYRSSEIRVLSVKELDYKENVYCCDVGVEEHSFMAEGVIISNCSEVVSEDDSDKCNLGTVWMNRCADKKEFSDVVKYGTMFLMCGGIYSDTPTQKIKEVGLKNNRIGLGLGGMHEWLMVRGMKYQVTPELHKWLSIYEQESNGTAFVTARQLNVAVPKGVRAIAPTGTIGILAETTTGIEPLFCKAYLRRYYKDSKWLSQYVIDGSVKRLLDKGIKIEDIQDSYDLTFQQRVKFQADVQNYVDMAISSTCNMSSWGSEENNEQSLEKNSEILLKYAKRLRGFTAYPDGCRGGQPLTRVSLQEAMEKEGAVFEEHETNCLNGICGI